MIVNTIYGPMDDALLKKRTGGHEDEDEIATWVEYRLGDELVHRSAHVTLKKMPPIFGEAAKIGG